MKLPNQTYFLGIDGGGSKCKARLEDAQGNLLAESIAGPANPVRDRKMALASIQQASQEAIELAGLPASTLAKTYAGIGLAGLNLPYYKNAMQEWQHPFAGLALSTDLHIACLGAHCSLAQDNSDSGAIVIVGTGSSALVCKNTKQFEYGGHGFLLGDKGSGAWFGLQTVRWALESFDGIQQTSPFIEAVCQFFDCTEAAPMVEKHLASSPAEFAKLAPLVFEFAEQQDPVATAIVKEGAAYLSALSRQLLSHKPQRLAFIGGLARKVQPWLDDDIQESLRAPFQSPESGAIILARKQFQVLENAL